jgi:HEAT repeat protein
VANAPSFWWQALKKGGDVLANVGEEIVGEKLKGQIEDKLKPVRKLLESPQARQAFQAAFKEASQEFERGALTGEERQLRREVVALLGRTTQKGVPDASREVIQRYVLASEPNRIPLDRWVQRQLGGGQLSAGDRVYSQEEVTLALDAFFQSLNRAFWEQPLFQDQIAQAGTTQLLRQILHALRTEADVDYAKALDADPTRPASTNVRDLHDKDRAPLFRHCLEKGECLVMLDGLDEVVDPRQRAEIADQVEALVADYPDNHYLLASRVVGYEAGRLTGDFTHFTLGPLPQASIQGFVQKWYEAIEREGDVEASEEARARADELCQAIEERPGIRRLAENPLLLTIIALVNWKGRKLPNRRVEVYRHAAETLVESWPRVRRGVIFDWEEVLNLLEPVAYRIFGDRSSEGITQAELLPLLAQAVAEIKPSMTQAAAGAYVADLLPRLSEHSGLFLEQGFDPQSGERIFGFLHLTFAEFLAARYLAGKWEAQQDGEKRRAFLAHYAHVPRWREVVLLMVEHVGLDGRRVPATQMLADLLQMEMPYEEHLQRNLLLAGQCLADDLRVEPAASDWVFDQLAALLLETPIGPLREGIAALAQEMAGTAYEGELVGRLLARLEDDNAELRDSAAWVLGQIGDQRAVEGLLARLEDDSPTVRASAAGALGRVGEGRAVAGLLACLEDDSAEVRAAAAWALEQIKSEQVVKGLLARLEDDSPAVRDRAAWVLGRIGDERAIEGLLVHLEDGSAAVRARAAGALGEIKSERAAAGLLARLEDKVAAVRARAAGALGRIGDERAVAGLLARLQDDNAEVRASVAWALGEIESKQALVGLLARLEDDVAAVRASAAGALGRIGDERAVAGLLARLEDDVAAVRARAAWALGRIGGERAAEGLLARLEDDSAEVCDSAAWALGRIGDERAVAGLLVRLEDDSPAVRASAAWALGRIGDERAVKGLLPWLEDGSAEVRASAAWALGRIGGERAVEGLLARLEDDSPAVRASAARALGEIKSRQALAGLLARLEDDGAEVRDSAVWALGRIGDERVVEHLLPWLSRAEFLSFILERACDWAYTTILEILAYHVPDPGVVPQSPSPEPVVVGPWSQA